MFKTAAGLRDLYPRLLSHSTLCFGAREFMNFLGRVGRCFRRLHAHGLIAKIPRTRRWRVTNYGRNVMGTSMYLSPKRRVQPVLLERSPRFGRGVCTSSDR